MKMYLLEFLLRKLWRVALPTSAWLVAILLPIALAQFGFLDFALIEGRCYRPLVACGQDNVSVAAIGIGLFLAVVATAVTVICGMWGDKAWVQEREDLKKKYQPAPPQEPTKPNIYD